MPASPAPALPALSALLTTSGPHTQMFRTIVALLLPALTMAWPGAQVALVPRAHGQTALAASALGAPGALVATPRLRRSAATTCGAAWLFEQGTIDMTADNDGVWVIIAPPTPAGAVVQQAHLLTNGEEGKDGCPQFEPTKSGGLELLVPIAKLQHCMPTGATDEGQTYALRARIDTFPKDPACQSGDITAEQPFGWAFTKETICGEGTLEGGSSAGVLVHVPVEISCGKVMRPLIMPGLARVRARRERCMCTETW